MTDPGAPPTTPPAPHRTVSPGLTGTLRGFYYATAATGLGAVFATVNETRRFADLVAGRPGALRLLADAEEVSDGLVGLFGLCGMVLAVLTIIWWYQAYQAIERTGATGRSWSAGWAIGGWFIPLANLIIPRLVLTEIDRVSAAAAEGSVDWRTRPLLATSSWWWGCFVAASIALAAGTGITADQIERGITDAELYRTGLWLTSAGLALDVAAALFAAASLRVFGSRLTR